MLLTRQSCVKARRSRSGVPSNRRREMGEFFFHVSCCS
jgi:hypothetical protein